MFFPFDNSICPLASSYRAQLTPGKCQAHATHMSDTYNIQGMCQVIPGSMVKKNDKYYKQNGP